MDKAQAIDTFWNMFGVPAFDENSVPDEVPDSKGNMVPLTFPYITYSQATDSLGNMVVLNASIWDRSTSWYRITQIADSIAKTLAEFGFYRMKLDDGYVWLVKGTPFAQRMGDQLDEQIKRIYLNVNAEYLTAY